MKKWRIVLVHLIFWFLFFIMATIIGVSLMDFNYLSQKILAFTAWAVLLFYANYSYLIPRFYEQKQFVLYFILSFLLVACVSAFRYFFEAEMITERGPENLERNDYLTFLRYFVAGTCVVGYALLSTMVSDWRKKEKQLYEWKALKNETDLKFLKNQLRPHFLFNSINNIYSVAVENEDKSAPLLLEISQMLRYMIYKTDQERIPVEEEINFLNSLIKLYSLRYDHVPFDKIDTGDSQENPEIPPLIFLPFIENLFKHGDFDQPEKDWLLRLTLQEGRLTFETKNPINRNDSNKESESGIGLSNLKQRLELLYSNKYKLHTQASNDSYYALLELNLNGK